MTKQFPMPLAQAHVEALLNKVNPSVQLQSFNLLAGSFSNETSRIFFKTAVGDESSLVVRRYSVFGEYDCGEKARREFKAFQLLDQHNIPVPKPLLLDTTGELLGTPGIVTSFVSGRQIIMPANTDNWVGELARTLAHIHTIPITEQEIEFLLDSNREVTWFLHRGQVTAEMAEYPDGRIIWQLVHDHFPHIQSVPPAFVHVDYWLGNILWQDGRITAVLDIEEAAYGDPAYDVAYMRIELAMLGGEALAEQFLAAYVSEIGRPVPNLAFWELAATARFMPNPEDLIPEWQTFSNANWNADHVRQNFSNFIASSIQRIREESKE